MSGAAALPIVGRVTSPTATLYLAGALLVMALLAGWSLWRLAGAGARCDVRIAHAQARGSEAVRKLVAGQEASIALIKAEDDVRLLTMQAAIPARQIERITVYRDRVRTITVPECRVDDAQVQAINEALQ
jgi:hypothetical protein